LRETGIGVISDMPWGTHVCIFYETKEVLIESAAGAHPLAQIVRGASSKEARGRSASVRAPPNFTVRM
jgi:hypothetical protein